MKFRELLKVYLYFFEHVQLRTTSQESQSILTSYTVPSKQTIDLCAKKVILVFEKRTYEKEDTLNKFIATHDFYRCDQCGEQQYTGCTMFSCRTRDYDLCENCFATGVTIFFFFQQIKYYIMLPNPF